MSRPLLSVRSRSGGFSRAIPTPRKHGGAVGRQVAVGSAPAAAPAKTDPLEQLQVWAAESGISAPKLKIFQLKGTPTSPAHPIQLFPQPRWRRLPLRCHINMSLDFLTGCLDRLFSYTCS